MTRHMSDAAERWNGFVQMAEYRRQVIETREGIEDDRNVAAVDPTLEPERTLLEKNAHLRPRGRGALQLGELRLDRPRQRQRDLGQGGT